MNGNVGLRPILTFKETLVISMSMELQDAFSHAVELGYLFFIWEKDSQVYLCRRNDKEPIPTTLFVSTT